MPGVGGLQELLDGWLLARPRRFSKVVPQSRQEVVARPNGGTANHRRAVKSCGADHLLPCGQVLNLVDVFYTLAVLPESRGIGDYVSPVCLAIAPHESRIRILASRKH